MSNITIQCCVVASEATRNYLWQIMVQKNTPLINELLKQVGKQDEFEQWLKKGKLPLGIVRPLCNSLATQKHFAGQPKRFNKSAIEVTEYIYKSWLALQKNRQRRLDGKIHWLTMLKSYKQLIESNDYSLENIKNKALEILVKHTTQQAEQQKRDIKNKKGCSVKKKSSKKLSTALFEAYDQTEDNLERCAIVYLLKNNCKIPDKEKDPEYFALYLHQKEIEIEHLKEQLASRMPHGRDLTGEEWLNTLTIATNTVPENEEEAHLWQSRLLKKPISIPFPIQFNTNEDFIWSKNHKGRICFKLNGLNEHIFEIYCDRRQIHWFKRFLEDQQVRRSDKNNYSSSLFTLRSGCLAWQKHSTKAKGEPWNQHRLILYCSIDVRLWTSEGTQQVIQDKAVEVEKKLTKMQEKEEQEELSPTQKNYIKRLKSTLAKLKNPYPRPSKPLYQPKTSILVGVSLGLAKPVTVAVVDASNNKVLAYRSVRQLLGKNYKLLSRLRRKKQRNARKRHKVQKRNQPTESELGKYLDNLFAKAILSLAQTYQAGSIVVPNMKNMRESLDSEIQTLAEKKCPNFKEGQKKYARQYRQIIHRWSYRRLIECIRTQASKLQIVVEEVFQPVKENNQEKARDLAISAYYSRQNKS